MLRKTLAEEIYHLAIEIRTITLLNDLFYTLDNSARGSGKYSGSYAPSNSSSFRAYRTLLHFPNHPAGPQGPT